MAVLSRKRPVLARGAALAALAFGVGCMVFEGFGPDEEGLAFSHAVHVGGEELDCVLCHEGFAVADEPGMPVADQCLFCHDGLDAEKPAEARVESLFGADGSWAGAGVSRLDDEVVFSHLAHVEAVDDCAACHGDVARSERVDDAVAVPMDDCTRCHEERAQPTDCATCHRDVSTSWAPDSHAREWTRLHGRASRAHRLETANRCSLCHRESTCAECHRRELPDSHTPHWRQRSHALEAQVDRAKCAVCHEPASCDRCHAEARPRSHVGPWGGTKSVHCLGCHFPLQANGCVTCHKGTPGHASAPPKPPWHTPVMNCRQCHGPLLPLPHVDNGGDCNFCHL